MCLAAFAFSQSTIGGAGPETGINIFELCGDDPLTAQAATFSCNQPLHYSFSPAHTARPGTGLLVAAWTPIRVVGNANIQALSFAPTTTTMYEDEITITVILER